MTCTSRSCIPGFKLQLPDTYSMTNRWLVGDVNDTSQWLLSLGHLHSSSFWYGCWIPSALAMSAGLARLNIGVPLIPTFHVPLCVAATVPEIVPVPCRVTGKGVLTTLTVSSAALPAGLTRANDRDTAISRMPLAITR